MRAIWVTEHGGPDVLNLEDLPRPEARRDQVLIRVAAAGVNPVDTYLRSGAYANAKVPYTPGLDCAGTVEAAGENVTAFKIGDRVYSSASLSGTYAEYALCDQAAVYPLPATLSFSQGAALGVPYATAYRALFHRASARAGETVLIHGGSGGVGIAAIQLAKSAGLRVIASSSTPAGLKLVSENGADHAINHSQPDYLQEVMRWTDNAGVNLILEMAAHVNLGRDLTVLAKFGRVVVIGSRGPIEINPRETMSRDAAILGMTLFNATPSEQKSIHAAMFDPLSTGVLRPVVGRELALSEAAESHRAVMAPGAAGKIVLLP